MAVGRFFDSKCEIGQVNRNKAVVTAPAPDICTFANSPKISLFTSGGLDGIRTRDLGLDRAACLAATPRDRAGCSLPFASNGVKAWLPVAVVKII